jgi:hypothetical protein
VAHQNPLVWAMLGVIWIYRRTLSPIMPARCRFIPSCSAYAAEAVATHGALRGGWLALRRLARCQPFCKSGFDPVPPAKA